MNTLVLLLLTAMVYMAFPLIKFAIKGAKFEKSVSHKIALWNSIIVGLFFCILSAVTESISTWNAAPAVFYYWINRAIITDKTSNITDITENKAVESTVVQVEQYSFNDTDSVDLLNQCNNYSKNEISRYSINFCRKCGNKIIISGSRFCSKCGEKLNWNEGH